MNNPSPYDRETVKKYGDYPMLIVGHATDRGFIQIDHLEMERIVDDLLKGDIRSVFQRIEREARDGVQHEYGHDEERAA